MTVLDVGAGTSPHPDADETLDIREDLDVDHPGVDIGVDEWPLESGDATRVFADDVFEHVPPQRLGHAFRECVRVLAPAGTAQIRVPHAGTWVAATDPTHCWATTADLADYFTADSDLEAYWASLPVRASSWAQLTVAGRPLPAIADGTWSERVASLPSVDGHVQLQLRRIRGSLP